MQKFGEIFKKFRESRAVSYTHLDVYKRQISMRLSTSLIAGTPSRVTTPSDKMMAGIKATTEFLAPDTVTSP